MRAVYDALTTAPRYVPQAIYEATGQELHAMVAGIIPGLLLCVGVLAASTALGAAVGAAIGALAFGTLAAPGAVVGAQAGFEGGTALLGYLGLAFLVAYIGESLWQAAGVAADGVKIAWRSVDDERQRWWHIERAANRLAFAVGLVFRGVLQGIIAFLLAKGAAAAASRVPELVNNLRSSKLGAGFAEWIEGNWKALIDNPRLKGDFHRSGMGGSGGAGASVGTVGEAKAAAAGAGAVEEAKTPSQNIPQRDKPFEPDSAKPETVKRPDPAKLASTEVGGLKPVQVRPGTNDKVAVIGRNMKFVKQYQSGLSGEGYNTELFDGPTISKDASDEWSNLTASGKRLSDEEIAKTLMYKENQAWAQKLLDQGYTVVDVGNPAGAGPSVFYDMERSTIFGGVK